MPVEEWIMAMETAESVDQYLSAIDWQEARVALARLRQIIGEEAPEAKECISYGMPGYKLNGYLLGFAAFKNHCSLFPGGTAEDFAADLKGFKTSKGTIQFTPDQPIPEEIVRKIVRARVAANLAKKTAESKR
jgi:uncharacterized protein YdhG (YjbR/CyaY superfamily)